MRTTILILLSVFFTVHLKGQQDCITDLEDLRSLNQEIDRKKLAAGVLRLEKCLQRATQPDRALLAGYHYFKGDIYRKKSQLDSFSYHLNAALKFAENTIPDENWLYKRLRHRSGILAFKQGNFAVARKYFDAFDSPLKIKESGDLPLAMDLVIANMSYCNKLDSLDKAIDIFNQGIELCEDQHTPFAQDRLSIIYSNAGGLYSKKGELLKAIEYNLKGADYFFRQHDDTSPQAMLVYNNLGSDYVKANNAAKAVFYLEKAYACFLQDHTPEDVPGDVILNNLGGAYHKMGDANKAIKAYEQVIAIRTKVYGPEHIRTAIAQLHASSMYVELEQPKEAIRLLKECRASLVEVAGPTHHYVLLCDQNLAVAYRDIGAYKDAQKHYESALKILSENHPPEHIAFASVMNNYGNLHKIQGNYPKALDYIQKALNIQETTFGKHAPETAYTTGMYAAALFKDKQQEAAFDYYEDAFKRFGISTADKRDFTSLQAPKSTVIIIDTYLNDLWESYKENQTTAYLSQIADRAEQGISLLEWQRDKFSGDQTKMLWTHKNYRLYEYFIVAKLKLFEITGDSKLLEAAAVYAERAKSNILLDALLQSGLTDFAGIPETIINQERQLKSELSFLELQLRSTEKKEASKWQEKVYAKRLELENYQNHLASAYPKYHKLFNQEKKAPLDKALPDNTAMISYFLGVDHLVIFGQSDKAFFHVMLPLEANFFDDLNALISLLNTPPKLGQNGINDDFVRLSSLVSKQLFEPVRNRLDTQVKHLLIIPDGILNYLPFETLLTGEVTKKASFQNLPYLLNDFNVSYAPSKVVWQKMRESNIPTKGILAVAPSFDQDNLSNTPAVAQRASLGPLVFNQEEVAKISALGYTNQLLLGEEATLEIFNNETKGADILHLATHAKVEATDNRYSYLAFTGAKTDTDTNKLYLSAVYNMDLPMNMVVLSACETGLGELRRGEGLMSLARGFTYAGAKSIVPSLWSVNDLSTANIMEQYYKALANGQHKDVALRKAKQIYIEQVNTPVDAHPYYWAAFIMIGDNEAISLSGGLFFWWWLIGLVAIALLVYYLIKKRQFD